MSIKAEERKSRQGRREHGYSAYTRGCRCAVCRKAKADYSRSRRAAALERANQHSDKTSGRFLYVADIKHGRVGYEEHGCRCPVCVETKRAAWRREYYAARARAMAS